MNEIDAIQSQFVLTNNLLENPLNYNLKRTPTSKHRHVELKYWFNKLNKRRKLAKIARRSRKRNSK